MEYMSSKTEKELAFIHDLFVALDWGERFAELIDEHIVLPKEAKALYLGSATGGHALALQERAGPDLVFTGIDERDEYLELARAKAKATNEPTEFRLGQLDALPLKDNEFDLVLGDSSLVSSQRISGILNEMTRVATDGSAVVLTLSTASSFGEFFSVYWEALYNSGLSNFESRVEELITQMPTVTQAEEAARNAGLENVQSWVRSEEFTFTSGEDFLSSPLVSNFLLPRWLSFLPEGAKEPVKKEIARIINEDRHTAEFLLTVKATLITGRKVLNQ